MNGWTFIIIIIHLSADGFTEKVMKTDAIVQGLRSNVIGTVQCSQGLIQQGWLVSDLLIGFSSELVAVIAL